MKMERNIDVAALDTPHRRALEEVIGCELEPNQRLVISIMELAPPLQDQGADRPAQTLEDWTQVYKGLNDADIEAIDDIAKTRANMTRDLP